MAHIASLSLIINLECYLNVRHLALRFAILLFPQKLTGCDACHPLEEAGEMMWVIEAEQM